MSESAIESLSDIRILLQRSKSEGSFSYEHNDELAQFCTVLLEQANYDDWAPALFELIEEFDQDVDLTLGSPGPLVHALESRYSNETRDAKYAELLSASLSRKPTGVAAHMASRLSRSQLEDSDFWIKKIKDILKHPDATVTAKEIAKDTAL